MKRDQYEEFISSEVADAGGFLGGQDLSQKLIEKFNVTGANARKIIERAAERNVVYSSSPFTFGKRQFLYVNNKSLFTLSGIIKISKKYSAPLHRLLVAFNKNGQVLTTYEGKKITASAYKNNDGKKTDFNKIIAFLKYYNVIEIKEIDDIQFLTTPGENEGLVDEYQRFIVECKLIPDVLKFMLNMYIIDDNNIIYRSDKKREGGIFHDIFVDAFGYSLIGKGQTTDTHQSNKVCVVLDAVLTREYLVSDIDGFYERVAIIKHSIKNGVREVIPIVVYYKAEATVASRIKALGFVRLNLSTVFGSKINSIIQGFSELDYAYINQENATEKIKGVLKTIKNTGQENNLQNIRGKLFECIIYLLLKNLYPEAEILFNKKLRAKDSPGKEITHEYDFIINNLRTSEIILVEVKGYRKDIHIKLGNSDEKFTVKWFTERKLKFAKENYIPFGNNLNYKICYIASCFFESDAIEYLQKLRKLKPSNPQLGTFYDGNTLREHLKLLGRKDLDDVIKEFYSK